MSLSDWPLFKLGDSDPEIAWVQRRLLSPVADGYFTAELEARIRGFQWANQLPMTGELDEDTYNRMRGDGN